jgi:general secretion pathway protein E
MGIYELLTVTDAFRSHVHTNVSLTTLRKQAVTDGMRPLRLAGALRASEGVTTLAEVIAATPPVD